ncbi:hypothetical protein BDR05DRAFT_1005493 [Suillus weaverae]|nr:hypothetical protein BDR05DRAFT_1005493 [Suillus weaverae]
MPSGCHHGTIDLGKKLSSFVMAPPIHDMHTMDKLTNSELNCLILKECQPVNKDELGHLLTNIFQSFTTEIPAVEELAIPLSSVPQNVRVDSLRTFIIKPDGAPMINLYNTKKNWWNWGLPSSYECNHSPTKNREQKGVESDKGSLYEHNRSPTKNREQKGVESDKGEWILVDEGTANADSLSESILSGSSNDDMLSSDHEDSSDMSTDDGDPSDPSNDGNEAMANSEDFNQSSTEHIFGSFFNIISVALLAIQPELAQKHHLSRKWSAANSSCPVHSENIKHKPDLALLDDVEARWDTIKAVCELTTSPYTPSGTLAKTLDTKAYLLLKHQPWRRFALMISLCAGYRELCVHLYDHSGGVYLQIFLSMVFGDLECVGLHSNWLPLHVQNQLKCLQVEAASALPGGEGKGKSKSDSESKSEGEGEGESDSESKSEGKSEGENECKNKNKGKGEESESTSSQDTTKTRDDDEFPVELPIEVPEDPLCAPLPEPIGKIHVNNHYYDMLEIIFSSQGLVGHGTICYLSRKDDEEFIIKDHWVLGGEKEAMNEINMMKKMSGVHGVPTLIEHCKTTFFWHMEHYVEGLGKQFHPYFKKLLPIVLEWYYLMREPMKATFSNVIRMLERHIKNLLMNEPLPELLVSGWLLKGLKAEHSVSGGKEGESQSPVDEIRRVHPNNKQVIDYRWTLEQVAPKSKRSKTG